MRIDLRIFVVMAVSAAASTAFAGVKYVAADDSTATQLCVGAAMDSRVQFHVRVQESGYSLRSVANNTTCNGVNIAEFGRQAGNSVNAVTLQKNMRGAGYVEIKAISDNTSTGGARSGAALVAQNQVILVRGK